ncbi:MAG: ABC transporter ATP-binding protein [Anaerolineae bacterium]|nr:ABC transporter ATP-binding protein [Anaerolineae bacterium]
MNAQPVIEIDHVSIEYRLGKNWVNVIHDVSLQIEAHEIHGLVGESGSGKTTLAMAVMRYLATNARVRSGDIRFQGESLLRRSMGEMRDIWGKHISLVPQDPLAALNPSYTVGDQIAEIHQRHNRDTRREAWRSAITMLEKVRIADAEAIAHKYPHQLSGGMQQRVTIAMALSTRPKLLILDEPTTALDVTTEATILDLFRDLIRENEAAALYVSHSLGVIAQMCDRMTVLYGGEVMASGQTVDLFKKPIHPYTSGLLASIPGQTPGIETRLPVMEGTAPTLAKRSTGCVFAERCPLAIALCHEQKPPLDTIEHGRDVKCHRWREIVGGEVVMYPNPPSNVSSTGEPKPTQDYVFSAERISKQFGSRTLRDRLLRKPGKAVRAVDDVSLRVRERATLGLVGESGSGKTTLARCIVGLETAQGGDMQLLDIPLSLELGKRTQAVRRELQMIFQNPNDTLNPYQTIGSALERAVKLLSPSALTPEQIQERVIHLLQLVRLPADYVHRYPAELSGGEKQRVAIARAFAGKPALVVADEPTSALDVSVQAVILNLLKDLRAEEGASYLFISHDLRAVSYLADWLMVMYLGEIMEEGSTEQVYGIPSHPYTEALISAIPIADPTIKQMPIRLDGEVPSASNVPTGCRFHSRCPRKIGAICEEEAPPWREAGNNHFIRCHIPIDELTAMQTQTREQSLAGRNE